MACYNLNAVMAALMIGGLAGFFLACWIIRPEQNKKN